MKAIIFFSIIVVAVPILLLNILQDAPQLTKLPLNKNSTIYAGEGEVCKTPYSEIKCENGLVCTTITEKPHINAVCLKPNTKLREDLVYKYVGRNASLN